VRQTAVHENTKEPMTELTDNDLVKRIADADESAMAVLYERYGARVFALANRVLNDRSLAEDITQEIFLKLWRNPSSFDPQRGKLRTLLLTQAHGRCVDVIRSRTSRSERETKVAHDPTVTVADEIDAELIALDEAEAVRAALDALPVQERTVIELAYFGANTYRDVAALLSLPEGTVKTRMRSALHRLRNELQSAPTGPTRGTNNPNTLLGQDQ
jgi:RNA polymerase sigma-70 factor, ECF subfamily